MENQVEVIATLWQIWLSRMRDVKSGKERAFLQVQTTRPRGSEVELDGHNMFGRWS